MMFVRLPGTRTSCRRAVVAPAVAVPSAVGRTDTCDVIGNRGHVDRRGMPSPREVTLEADGWRASPVGG